MPVRAPNFQRLWLEITCVADAVREWGNSSLEEWAGGQGLRLRAPQNGAGFLVH
jgi:hypothetical protein